MGSRGSFYEGNDSFCLFSILLKRIPARYRDDGGLSQQKLRCLCLQNVGLRSFVTSFRTDANN